MLVKRGRVFITTGAALAGVALWMGAAPSPVRSPIWFAYQPIDFRVDSCETPDRHAPETMAGGVAIFD
jgi:enediyne biosynthesis protein E4